MIELGVFYGLPLKFTRMAFAQLAGLVVLVALAVIIGFNISPLWAVLGALIFTAAHVILEVIHQWGHFYAGKLLGYPMQYVVIKGVLGTSIYPPEEPPLAATIHRRRALGGPVISLLVTIGVGLVALVFYFGWEAAAWLPVLIFLDSLGVFTIGAFIPLHMIGLETDGSTLLKYWRQP